MTEQNGVFGSNIVGGPDLTNLKVNYNYGWPYNFGSMVDKRPYTINRVCVEPFPDNSVKTELVGDGAFKVAKMQNTKSSLVKLKVLKVCRWNLPSGNRVVLEPGDMVAVRASEYASPWGKEIFEQDGEKFIMLPCERIEFVEPS